MSVIAQIDDILDAYDGTLVLDFSKVPSNAALAVAQNSDADAMAGSLAKSLGFRSDEDQTMLRDEVIGVIAALVDTYLQKDVTPK